MSNYDRALAVLESARRPGDLRIHPHDAVEALAKAGLIASDDMDWQEADYRPPRFYTLDEIIEKGPNLGDNVTRAKRLVGPWEEA